MFFDETQRYGENEYEWLRYLHDHLDRIDIRLFALLIAKIASGRSNATRTKGTAAREA
jgi:hypothetical protein